MSRKKNFLFDLNGTMINDMDFHITSWHKVLNDEGASITWEHMRDECYGKNEEIVERIFPGRFTDEDKLRMSLQKEKQYQLEYKPHLKLLPGLADFLKQAQQHEIGMAIGSAAIMHNINFVLDNLSLHSFFDVIVSADDVKLSKPDPETYLTCAEKLDAANENCIVFEDSTKGVESAMRGGMKCVALTTLHEQREFEQYPNVLAIVKDYTDERLQQLFFK